MSLATHLAEAAAVLAEAGVEQPRREARLLLGHATGLDGAALLRNLASDMAAPGFDRMVTRRAAREPYALIVGRQPFWTFDVAVSPDTLIPRADSETLIEAAVAAFPGRQVGRVLDLGTGTGCLLLAALREFPGAFGVGVDRAPGATALARGNADALGLMDRTAFVCGDWAAALHGRFDLVLSNPPYIETPALATLMPEVAWFEPAAALDGGGDGLACYRTIIAGLPDLLAPAGIAILELGLGQAEAVAGLASAAGLQPGPPSLDLAGVARALTLRLGKKTVGEAQHGR